jgi:hypothetical protein
MLPATLLLLAAPNPETAVDAERAFSRAAQTEGQWTAFRHFMTDDAVIFTPQPANAKDALPEKDPPVAVQWWPAESYVSCDGSMAVNTGPWTLPKSNGYFTTVWVRQSDGHYKWAMDGGDTLAVPRAVPAKPKIRRASCKRVAVGIYDAIGVDDKGGEGSSKDGTLLYQWTVHPDGSREFVARLWDGETMVNVVHNQIAAGQ